MKNLSFAILLAISAPTWAQVEINTSPISAKESGSGNGSIDRELLNFRTDTTEAKESLQTFRETFDQLVKEIHSLSNAEAPNYQGPGNEFWDQLTPKDQETILAYDLRLIEVLKVAIREIEVTKKSILIKEATVNSMAASIGRYEERGMEKKLKKFIQQNIKSMKGDLKDGIVKVVKSLFKDAASEAQKKTFLNSCDSAMCVDLVGKKLISFFNKTHTLGKIKISMLGETKTIKALYNHSALYDHGKCRFGVSANQCSGGPRKYDFEEWKLGEVKSRISKQISQAVFDTLTGKHEALIRDNN